MNIHQLNKSNIRFLVILCLVFGFLNQPTVAFGQAFDQTLEVSGFWEQANDIVANSKQNWLDIEPTLQQYEKAIAAKDQKAIDVKTIGKTYAKAQNILRDSKILVAMGEPAGIDFGYRGDYSTTLIEKTRDLMKGTPAANKIMGQAAKYKKSSDSKRTKSIKKMGDFMAKSQFDKAEEELRSVQSDVDTFILWLAPRDAQAVVNQYSQANQAVTNALKKLRNDKTLKLVSEDVEQKQLDLDGLVKAANQAASDVQSKGSTTIDGNSVNGAEAFSQLCLKWEQAHGKMLNCMGMTYATSGKLSFPVKDLFGANSKSTKWTDAGYELHKNMQTALVKIIEADAATTSAGELPQKYAQYVNAVGYMADRVSDNAFVAECNKALGKLAKKDSAFESRVANYRKATDDMLAWRAKFAQAAAKSATKEYVAPKAIIGDQKCVPQLKAGLPQVINSMAGHIGKKTSLQNVFGLTETASYAGHSNRIWTGIKGNLTQKEQVDALAADLFLSDNQPPLTVNAAAAVSACRNNDLEAIGGSIKSFHADGLATRLAKLSPKMAAFIPIGELPKDKADLDDMLLRVTIDPEWIQHKYFFVKLK